MIPDLVVRADADADIGLGHLVRSMALAGAWRARGGAAVLATTTRSEAVPASVQLDGVQLVPLPGRHPDPADRAATREVVSSLRDPWIVVDGYAFDAGYTGALRRAGGRVLVIDDLADQAVYQADLLLNPNLGAEALDYRFEGAPLRLFGPRFLPLPPAFVPWRGRARSVAAEPGCLVLTLGGSAQRGAAAALAAACARFRARHPLRVVVLAGPGASTAAWTAAAAGAGLRADVVSDPPDVPALLAGADLAISAAGSTAWQLCFLGVPTLLTALADNQRPIAERLAAAGCALDMGPAGELTPATVEGALERLLGDRAARDAMSRRARALVDGRGAERVTGAMVGEEEDPDAA